MSYPVLAVQQAVYAALNEDSALQALVEGIYDQPPADAVYPFVAIESISAQDWRFVGGKGVQASLTLRAYSRYHGMRECHQILQRMDALLHDAALSAAGLEIVQLRVSSSDVTVMSDQRTTRGTLQVNVDAYEAAGA